MGMGFDTSEVNCTDDRRSSEVDVMLCKFIAFFCEKRCQCKPILEMPSLRKSVSDHPFSQQVENAGFGGREFGYCEGTSKQVDPSPDLSVGPRRKSPRFSNDTVGI